MTTAVFADIYWVVTAPPHEWGAGKTHAAKLPVQDGAVTMCGTLVKSGDGWKRKPAATANLVTCKTCRRSVTAAARRQEGTPEYEARQAEFKAQREAWDRDYQRRKREWDAWYAEYLKSPEWKARRAAVMDRAGGTCEGCLSAPATAVHHLTYDRVGDEMMFDLVAICDTCHSRIHSDKEAR